MPADAEASSRHTSRPRRRHFTQLPRALGHDAGRKVHRHSLITFAMREKRPAPQMKKIPFTTTKPKTPDDEMRTLERELLPLRARERQLLDEISTARSELARE